MSISVTPTTITIFGVVDDSGVHVQLQSNTVDLSVTADDVITTLAWSTSGTPGYVRTFLTLATTGVGVSDTGTATVVPNASSLAGSNAALVTALQNGTNESAVLNVEDGLNGLVGIPITIQFRALRTTDFILTGGTPATLQPAYHSGTPAGNFHTNVNTGTYAFTTPDVTATSATGSLTLSGSITNASQITNPSNRLLTITGGATPSELNLDIHIPTDVVALLDRSGSMNAIASGTLSRWDSAHQVASAFSLMFKEMVVDASAPGVGTVADQHKIDFGFFYSSGGAQTDFAGGVSGMLDAKDGDPPPVATPGGGTPIVQGIVNAAGRFTPDAWRLRHIVLLTDGIHNVGAPTLGEISGYNAAAAEAFGVPQAGSGTASAPTAGVTIHTISYSAAGETEEINLGSLSGNYGGQHHVSATDADPVSVTGLFQRFLDVLSSIIPLERLDVVGANFSVEDYLDRMMVFAVKASPGDTLVVGDNLTLGTVLPQTYGPLTGNGPRTTAGSNGDYLWLRMDRPRFDASPGAQDWSITTSPGTPTAVLFDLALTMKSGATRAEPGEPITVWTEITHLGKPLSGANVRAGVSRPGESLGALLTNYVRSGKLRTLNKNVLSQLSSHGVLRTFDAQAHASAAHAFAATASVDVPGIQRILLSQVEELRNLPFQHLGSSLELKEVSPGRYEGVLLGAFTQEEGSYGFQIRATGTTAVGAKFGRDRRVTTAVVPMPDEASSETTVVQVASSGGQTTWLVTVLPKTTTQRPLGPGLGHSVSFHYLDEKAAASLPPLVCMDNLDGTYSATLTAKDGQAFPPIGFTLTAYRAERRGIRITEPQKQVERVKVTLSKLQILDDKDGCLTGKGELAFDAVLAPNANPNRAVRTRLPQKGVFKADSGEMIAIDEVLFDGYIEKDATLAVTIGGKEFDWFLFFQRQEPLARYHRLLSLKKGKHTFSPEDEPNDPESLADWKVWYTVEVS
jgi:hypothetical protein